MALEQSKKKENKPKSGKSTKGQKTGKKNDQGNTSKGKKIKGTGKLSVQRKVLHESDEESEEDGYFCLICCDPFDPKKSGEEWVECVVCKNWSHVKCVRGNIVHYVCLNCESDCSDYSD